MSDYAIGWGGLAVINAALASIDGRSPLKYLLGSLFMGPLLTILIASTREEDGALRQVDLWKGRGRA
jgi:peptidoglycan/LPS O-acetylase OafA/YrhL